MKQRHMEEGEQRLFAGCLSSWDRDRKGIGVILETLYSRHEIYLSNNCWHPIGANHEILLLTNLSDHASETWRFRHTLDTSACVSSQVEGICIHRKCSDQQVR